MSAAILNINLIKHPLDTYFVRFGGSILVVDRAAITDDGDTVIVRLHDQLMVTTLNIKDGSERVDYEVWGKVAYFIFEA
jgi:SOS-response transcriptional repressor LexA